MDNVLNTISNVFLFYFQSLTNFIRINNKRMQQLASTNVTNTSNKVDALEGKLVTISGGDINIVMGRLGLVCDDGDKLLQERYDASELSRLFEEDEPSLDELKEAFDIFDGNKDGFIDGQDLLRVLCCLGFFKEGVLRVDKCTQMISAVIKERDGSKIDFHEFVRFMDKCLS